MKYLTSFLSLAAASAFFLIVSVDQQSNVTARVLDGTIFPLVDQAQTTVINGVADRHVESATANKMYLRRHCDTHLRFLGQSTAGCGYGTK
jgi:hypothetical protein